VEKDLTKKLREKNYVVCTIEDVENDFAYRGANFKETVETIELGHGVNQPPQSLIGNDWEVLEYAYDELREMSPSEAEKFLSEVVPEWATKQGLNLTTDLSNAQGYAESRNGKLLVFDISQISEMFTPSDVHIQIKKPSEAKLAAVCDSDLEVCYCKK